MFILVQVFTRYQLLLWNCASLCWSWSHPKKHDDFLPISIKNMMISCQSHFSKLQKPCTKHRMHCTSLKSAKKKIDFLRNFYVIFAQVERNLNAFERNLNVIWTQSERFTGIHVHSTGIYVPVRMCNFAKFGILMVLNIFLWFLVCFTKFYGQ